MAKIKQIFILFNLLLSVLSYSQIKVAAERTQAYLPLLENNKIAVVGNQTSMIKQTHIVDSLISLGIDIVKVFSPEHGFRGKADAGAKIEDGIDIKTGLPIISLYGKNKKPYSKQLEGIDILLFDIQDVGARFYTYISTLHYVMEAAGENDIKVIVLDRPNPNGHYIDGPIREDGFESFVGMHPIPIVHGMTVGEYAKMINGENWISQRCDLIVIEMENYTHDMHYDLPIKPSPNLPNSRSINLYPTLCLFEGTTISIGRGTDYPFQHFGAPYLESNYSFTPKSVEGSKYPKHENIECFGTDLRFQDNYLTSINLNWIINSYNNYPDKEKFFTNFFDKLAGTDKLRLQIIEGKTSKEIKESWKEDLDKFKIVRKKYILYEHYPMYSDIWSIETCSGSPHMIRPNDNGYFPLRDGLDIRDYIDVAIVKSYLLQSLNEFRKDYGVGPVKESQYLNKISQNYCNKMSKMPRIKHDNLHRYSIQMAENISSMTYGMFTHLNEDNDLNKIMADAVFDQFVCSNGHMRMLLSDNKWFGFGFVKYGNSYYVVIKASSDSSVK